MFPNPQDALPLPPRPNLEQYRKLAKDLVKACQSGSIAAWADRWMAALLSSWERKSADRAATEVEEFAVKTLTRAERRCVLADAQFVLARSHGFVTWPAFATHLDGLAHSDTQTAAFEAAAGSVTVNAPPVALAATYSLAAAVYVVVGARAAVGVSVACSVVA